MPAEPKVRRHLYDFLTPEQRKQYRDERCLQVVGSLGNTYEICGFSPTGNIRIVNMVGLSARLKRTIKFTPFVVCEGMLMYKWSGPGTEPPKTWHQRTYISTWCAHPSFSTMDECVLIQMLNIQFNEEEFLRIANPYTIKTIAMGEGSRPQGNSFNSFTNFVGDL